MNKNFRYAVFLSLFFRADPEFYQIMFRSFYADGDSPMSALGRIMDKGRKKEAFAYADDLLAAPPKVVE